MFKKILFWLLVIVLLGVFVFSGYQLWDYFSQSHQVNSMTNELYENYVSAVPTQTQPTQTNSSESTEESQVQETAPIVVDFETLTEQYEDVVGWIYCADTILNYPIAQGESNDTYLRALLDGSYNYNGTIFMDYRNRRDFTDANSIIYGHNMNTDDMFACLTEYQSQEYYDAHPYIYLLTPQNSYKLHLIAGDTVTTSNPLLRPELDGDALDEAVQDMIENSDFQSLSEYNGYRNVITLVTCEYDTANSRYLLVCQAERIG